MIAPDENLIWGGGDGVDFATGVANIPEKTLFPGLLILVFAIAGASWRGWPQAAALGPRRGGARESRSSHSASARRAACCGHIGSSTTSFPGGRAIRTPGRLTTFSSLAPRPARRPPARRGCAPRPRFEGRARLAAGVAAVLALAIAIEGRGLPFDPTDSQAQPRAPTLPPSTAAVPAPQLHLPAELGPRTTAATCFGRPTASRSSSTAARAQSRRLRRG